MKRFFLIALLLTSCAFAQTFGNIPAAGNISTFGTGTARTLQAQWTMNQTSGTTATDSSGSTGHDLALTNTTWYVSFPGGLLTRSLSFDGSTSTAIPSSGTGITPDYNTPFSISLWFNNQDVSATYPRFYSTINGSTKGFEVGLQWMTSSYAPIIGMYSTYSSNALQLISNVSVTRNTWHHIVWTHDGSGRLSGIKVYLDGTQITTSQGTSYDTLSASIGNGNKPYVGGRPTQDATTTLKGYMSTLCYNNRVLTAAEVSTMYATPGTCITY